MLGLSQGLLHTKLVLGPLSYLWLQQVFITVSSPPKSSIIVKFFFVSELPGSVAAVVTVMSD